ncbi:hypothetical protein Mgra_00000509, partial [Meloidogyne graminicola]
IYCLIQFGLLFWQIQVVKEWKWYWENRELPATGVIDQYQARFPGLYARYSETPESRKINALFVIVFICLGLTFIHLFTSIAMLYGCYKLLINWIFPWFFTSIPLIIFCTIYSILWWSGDIFAEQLTFSVFEFIISLALNGIGIILIFLYFQRLKGKLVSERINYYRRNSTSINQNKYLKKRKIKLNNNNLNNLLKYKLNINKLPNWINELPEQPSKVIEYKLRRKEKKEAEMIRKLQQKRKRKKEILNEKFKLKKKIF